jgi:hypothetical protein
MTPRIAAICAELESPPSRSLQELLLEAMLIMEHHRGIHDTSLGYSFDPADLAPEAVALLAESLARFIERFATHPDAGSAVWALGKLHDAKYVLVNDN